MAATLNADRLRNAGVAAGVKQDVAGFDILTGAESDLVKLASRARFGASDVMDYVLVVQRLHGSGHFATSMRYQSASAYLNSQRDLRNVEHDALLGQPMMLVDIEP